MSTAPDSLFDFSDSESVRSPTLARLGSPGREFGNDRLCQHLPVCLRPALWRSTSARQKLYLRASCTCRIVRALVTTPNVVSDRGSFGGVFQLG